MTKILIGMDHLDALGGVQTVVRTLASAFSNRGHQVSLLDIEPADTAFHAPTPPGGPLAQYRLSAHPSGLPYEPTTSYQSAKLLIRGRLRGLHTRKNAVVNLGSLAARNPDAVWLLTQWRLVEHAVAAGISRRTIGQYHDSFAASVRNNDLPRILRAAPHLAATCVLTESDARRFREAGVPRVHVVTNPVPRQPTCDVPRGYRVLAAGRFVAQKAFDVLVEAWSLIGPERDGWTLTIAGSGPLEPVITAAIDRHRVRGSVQLEPATQDMASLFSAASIFAMSSIHEGLPIVLTEALSAGIPFASTPCAPGVAELADDGRAGLLAASHDPRDLAEVLRKLMADPELRSRMGEYGRRSLAMRSPDKVAATWERLFHQLDLTSNTPKDSNTPEDSKASHP